MNNDTKYNGIMSNDVKSINSDLQGDTKTGIVFLVSEALDFLMTQDNDFLVVSRAGVMTNEIKL